MSELTDDQLKLGIAALRVLTEQELRVVLRQKIEAEIGTESQGNVIENCLLIAYHVGKMHGHKAGVDLAEQVFTSAWVKP